MDINKYIGQFLLKNKYCSLPGLGVFDLKKESARIHANDNHISAPKYTIVFTPVGSIDDTFASFIASAENVSISNASNNIKEYCKNVKEQLAKSGRYEIEFLGSFGMSNGRISFQQSDDLDLGNEPAPLPPLLEKPKLTDQQTAKPDYSYPPASSGKKSGSGLKIFLWILLLAILGGGAWFGYDYYTKNYVSEPEEEVIAPEILPVDTIATLVDTSSNLSPASIQDSTLQNDSLASSTRPSSSNSNEYNVVILSYNDEASANAKSAKLNRYGNNTSVVNSNGKFVVAIKAVHPLNDTTLLVDSLRRFFNPKGQVYILK
ncbi:MAG: hypothetical protein IPI46_05200 [Bacteroidetes bacterium]|nr:hypothetical protein [Bacteroidota bacterium]